MTSRFGEKKLDFELSELSQYFELALELEACHLEDCVSALACFKLNIAKVKVAGLGLLEKR